MDHTIWVSDEFLIKIVSDQVRIGLDRFRFESNFRPLVSDLDWTTHGFFKRIFRLGPTLSGHHSCKNANQMEESVQTMLGTPIFVGLERRLLGIRC